MSIDCGFFEGDCWFRYRAAAIIVEDGAALFAGNCEEPFYYAVGGGVHVGETAEDAVVREVEEETGVHYDVDRLAVVHENFFDGKGGAWEGKLCHEVCFYYLMKPRHTRELDGHGYTHGVREEMHWIDIDALDTVRAYPSFLKDYLATRPAEILHIVTDQRACPTAPRDGR